MIPAADYIDRIKALGIDGMELSASSQAEAKATITRIRSLQSELRQIKKSINLDIKSIRADYTERIANAGSVTGGIFSLFGKRRAGGSIRAAAKRDMTKQRDSVIAPYEEIKLHIDTLINKLDEAKHQFMGYVAENKASESKKGSPGFCPSCGAKVAKSHRFCASCGGALGE